MMPFVSAIIPVHNGANYLAEAIVSCLQQTAPVGEIIVVDDGSTDDTAKIAGSFGEQVTYLHQAWNGAAAALNAGIQRSQGEYLAFLDHDDLWDREKTSRQLARMQARGELEAVFGQVEQFISPELTSVLEGRVQIPAAPQPGISVSAMLIRRSAWERIGPFAGGKDALAFPAWYPRATEMKLVMEVLPDIVFKRRIHTSNYSRTQRDQLHDQLLNLMRRKIDRTRRTTPSQ